MSPPTGKSGDEPARLIQALSLVPHPEGGWYRETWRAAAEDGARATGTAIYFLLEAGEKSQWHQIDADEIWLWHAGAPIELSFTDDTSAASRLILLGPNLLAGQTPQSLVAIGYLI